MEESIYSKLIMTAVNGKKKNETVFLIFLIFFILLFKLCFSEVDNDIFKFFIFQNKIPDRFNIE